MRWLDKSIFTNLISNNDDDFRCMNSFIVKAMTTIKSLTILSSWFVHCHKFRAIQVRQELVTSGMSRRHWHDEKELLLVRLVESYRKNVAHARRISGRALGARRILKSIRKYCKSNQVWDNVVRARQLSDQIIDVKRIWLSNWVWNAFGWAFWWEHFRAYAAESSKRGGSSNIEHDSSMQEAIVNCETYRRMLRHLVRTWACKQESRYATKSEIAKYIDRL